MARFECNRRLARRVTVVCVLMGIHAALFGQLVTGKVVDADSGAPVPFASVGIVGTALGTSTNQQGEFTLALSGRSSVKVTCIGYESQVITVVSGTVTIHLKPTSTLLDEVVIYQRAVNPRKVVRKAFSNIAVNYTNESFLQKFFYRHYCKDDSAYGRLVEAFVSIWKSNGYRNLRTAAGEREAMQVTHLRRSMDRTVAAQGHEPLSIGYALAADAVGYQTPDMYDQVRFHNSLSDLKTNSHRYRFAYHGVTTYDGEEVYRIGFEHLPDSVLTTSGYVKAAAESGMLYITTRSHAFIRVLDTKTEPNGNLVSTAAYYRKFGDTYYPYHFIREGDNTSTNGSKHWFHIELMSVETESQAARPFEGWEPGKEKLRTLPYDSTFWNNQTLLKSTPLEETIIRNLGGGLSLQEQFALYNAYEANTHDGGTDGESKFRWLQSYATGKQPMYLCVWAGDVKSYLVQMENFKRLNQKFRNRIIFVMISTEQNEEQWQQRLRQYNLFADGIIHYRVDASSALLRDLKVSRLPSFVRINSRGQIMQGHSPAEAVAEAELNELISE